MKKKFFLGLLFTFLLAFALGFSMDSYAAISKQDLTSELQKIKDAGLITGIPNLNVSEISGLLDQCIYYFILITDNVNTPSSYRNRIIICACNDNVVNRYDGWGSGGSYVRGNVYGLDGANKSTGWFDLNKFTYIYAYTTVNINTNKLVLGAGEEFGYEILTAPQFDFTPGSSTIVKVGNYNNVYLINYWPTTPIVWGTLNNYNDLNISELSYSLGIMTPDGNDEILFNYVEEEFRYLSHYYWQTPARKIYMNRVYKLFVNYEDEEYVYVYYIAPYGTNYTSGETIGYFYNSGDSAFDTQVATNTIIDSMTDTQQVDMTLDSMTSGDIYNNLGYTEYHTTWNNFMYDMFIGIENALFSSGDIAFTFPYMRTTITLHSSDFTTPPGLLKGFCSSFLMFGFIVLVYQHIARFYHRLQEGAVNQVVEEFNVDDETLIL